MIRRSAYSIIFALALVLPVSVSAQSASPKAPDNAEAILLKEAAVSQEEELSIAKARQKETMSIAQEAAESLDKCASLSKVWESEIVPLLTSEDGQFLTAKPDYVKAFSGYYNAPHPTQREIDRLRESLNTLGKPLKAALDDAASTYVPASGFLSQLEEYKNKAVLFVAGYEEPVRMIKALLARAKSDGKKGADMLGAAVDQLTAEIALEKGQELDAQLKAKQKESAKRMGDAQQQALEDKAKLAEDAAKQDTQIAKEQADKEALVKLARSPDIQKRLAPFITPGMTQIAGMGGFSRAPDEAKPVSFSALNRVKALSPDDRGRNALARLATHPKNDRPKWHKPVTSEDWKWVKENQEYLRTLSPVLIELGMLNP